MTRLKLNSNPAEPQAVSITSNHRTLFVAGITLMIWFMAIAQARGNEVALETARQVARQKLEHHIALYGHWNHTTTPAIAQSHIVQYEGDPVAYNFDIEPSGHILVAVDDVFSPVLLYSTTSALDMDRLATPHSVESWVVPEVGRQVARLAQLRTAAEQNARTLNASSTSGRIARAWQVFKKPDNSFSSAAVGRTLSDAEIQSGAAGLVGPLLQTAWGQSSLYNLFAPEDGCGAENTFAGCVALAWAQLMRYWHWPLQGSGSHAYEWVGDTQTLTLSADFAGTHYDWANMPAVVTGSSSPTEQEAVALLIYHAGIAAEMDFGCTGSGSSAWADDVLDLYFDYKANMRFYSRSSYQASAWFALFQAELDADPPRPVVFSINGDGGGHKVVVDGYQQDATDMVHINFGWDGNYDGYYDITSDFDAGLTWYGDEQYIVAGIEPDNDPPLITINADQVVEEGTQVQLNAEAEDPEGVGITGYQWSQTSGPAVTLSDTGSTSPTFTAPDVTNATNVIFSFRADDANLAFATKSCTITVYDPDVGTDETGNNDTSDTSLPLDLGSTSSSSGGCFIGTAFYRWKSVIGDPVMTPLFPF